MELATETFGLTASSLSRRFKRASAKKLAEMSERDLSGYDLVALFLDGKTFGDKAAVQRCQWHKRENVVGYLPTSKQATFRHKLQRSYNQPTYDKAKSAMARIRSELSLLNASAVGSLDEGFEAEGDQGGSPK